MILLKYLVAWLLGDCWSIAVDVYIDICRIVLRRKKNFTIIRGIRLIILRLRVHKVLSTQYLIAILLIIQNHEAFLGTFLILPLI